MRLFCTLVVSAIRCVQPGESPVQDHYSLRKLRLSSLSKPHRGARNKDSAVANPEEEVAGPAGQHLSRLMREVVRASAIAR